MGSSEKNSVEIQQNRPFQRGLGLRATFPEDGGYEGILSAMLDWTHFLLIILEQLLALFTTRGCQFHRIVSVKFPLRDNVR